jgi:CRP/FNR family transcriptional regulator, cyclic AMP receptor protein
MMEERQFRETRSGGSMTPEPADPFASIPFFAGLDPARRVTLAAASRMRRYARGQVLCNEGDPGDDLLVLEEGRIRVCRFSLSGQEIVLAEVDAPATFGELALIDGGPRAADVIAESDVRVRYLPRRVVLDLVSREPAMALALMKGLAAMVRTTNERFSDLLALDVPGRLAKWLLAHADDSGKVPLDQSQEALARSIGTTRVSVNRSLGQFARRGLIYVRDGEIIVRDRAQLRSISEG